MTMEHASRPRRPPRPPSGSLPPSSPSQLPAPAPAHAARGRRLEPATLAHACLYLCESATPSAADVCQLAGRWAGALRAGDAFHGASAHTLLASAAAALAREGPAGVSGLLAGLARQGRAALAPAPSGGGGEGKGRHRYAPVPAGLDPSEREALPVSALPAGWERTSRNALCPCGSGKKFKHCHGALI